MKTIHIFHIRSNFHLILAQNIISKNKINNDFYFVVKRNVNLKGINPKNILKINNKKLFNFWDKLMCQNLPYFLNDKNIYIKTYLPFFNQYPNYLQGEINFFEEGFSAYSNCRSLNPKFKLIEFFKSTLRFLIVNILFFFKSKRKKKFILGPLYFYVNFKSNKKFNYYTLNDKVDVSGFPNLNLEVLKINKLTSSNKFSNKCIIVLDRITHPKNFEINNYIKIISKMINDNKKFKNIYVKFHPFDSEREKTYFYNNFLFKYNKIVMIDDSLEDIAISNENVLFLGTNSTMIFYASLIGNNMSISYAKYLAEIDFKYSKFLEFWGSKNRFFELINGK